MPPLSDGTAIVPRDFPIERADIAVVRLGDPALRIVDGHSVIAFEGREVQFDFVARHQAGNALAALHAARALGLEVDGLVEVVFSRWRGDEIELAGGGLLVNDAYNANPMSVRAALEHLVDRAEGRRTVAVLGDMAELGPDAPAYHREVGELAAQLGVGVLVGVGPLSRETVAAAAGVPVTRWTASAAEAVKEVEALLEPGDCVLVKASRAMGLERVAEALAAVRT